MEQQQRPGEELFDRLNQEKKQRRRKVVRTVIIVIAVIALALVLLVLSLRRSVEKKFAAAEKGGSIEILLPRFGELPGASSDLAYARPPSPEGKALTRQISIFRFADKSR